jgi:hypothetical protein
MALGRDHTNWVGTYRSGLAPESNEIVEVNLYSFHKLLTHKKNDEMLADVKWWIFLFDGMKLESERKRMAWGFVRLANAGCQLSLLPLDPRVDCDLPKLPTWQDPTCMQMTIILGFMSV